MSNENKDKISLLTSYIEHHPSNTPQKRTSIVLSPGKSDHQSKKANLNMEKTSAESEMTDTKDKEAPKQGNAELKNILGPLIEEVKLLREAVDVKYTKLEDAITTQKIDIKESLSNKIDDNNRKIQQVLQENASLHKENNSLKERLDRIEIAQLSNNVIIMGIPEQTWESYDTTKRRVIDTIAASKGTSNDPTALEEAQK